MLRAHHIFFSTCLCGLVLGVLPGTGALASDIVLVAVGPFGGNLVSCKVDSFHRGKPGPDGAVEYRDHFQGTTGKDLPEGNYEATFRCPAGVVSAHVEVSPFHSFQVMAQYTRTMRSDHVIPSLAIHLLRVPQDNEVWWIRLHAVYSDQNYTAELDQETGDGQVLDPDPGSYIVSVLSSGGYACVREIDLVERTRSWTFDPSGCTFRLDAFAHEVTEEDRQSRKNTAWYQQMKRDTDEFFRALDSASDTPLPHN